MIIRNNKEVFHKKSLSNYTFNRELFLKPTELTKYLHDRGVKLGLTLDPSEGIHPHEPKYSEIAKAVGSSDKSVIPLKPKSNPLRFVN